MVDKWWVMVIVVWFWCIFVNEFCIICFVFELIFVVVLFKIKILGLLVIVLVNVNSWCCLVEKFDLCFEIVELYLFGNFWINWLVLINFVVFCIFWLVMFWYILILDLIVLWYKKGFCKMSLIFFCNCFCE